jgi:hypothetical protein
VTYPKTLMRFPTSSQDDGDFWKFRWKIDNLMKLTVIVTPKGTSVGKTASFETLRVSNGRSVRPVDDLHKLKTKKAKCVTSPHRGRETPGAIAMNFFFPFGSNTAAINCENYDLDRSRGFQLAGPRKAPSPVANVHHSYNVIA